MDRDKIIKRTILQWADGIGIVSINSQKRLAEMIIKAIDEVAQQNEQAKPCEHDFSKTIYCSKCGEIMF